MPSRLDGKLPVVGMPSPEAALPKPAEAPLRAGAGPGLIPSRRTGTGRCRQSTPSQDGAIARVPVIPSEIAAALLLPPPVPPDATVAAIDTGPRTAPPEAALLDAAEPTVALPRKPLIPPSGAIPVTVPPGPAARATPTVKPAAAVATPPMAPAIPALALAPAAFVAAGAAAVLATCAALAAATAATPAAAAPAFLAATAAAVAALTAALTAPVVPEAPACALISDPWKTIAMARKQPTGMCHCIIAVPHDRPMAGIRSNRTD